MPKLFLIPTISIFDIHDVALREWLSGLDNEAIRNHLEYPFKLYRYFPESSRRALKRADDVQSEILHLLDIINPQAVFLDISIDLVGLENKYNKRLISPQQFWSEYYQEISADMSSPAKTIYTIYIKEIINKSLRLIESKERLPLSVVFYGVDIKTREELIPVYENVLDKDGEFILQAARVVNEITSLRELPKHIWYSSMKVRQTVISYEETERFYNELANRLGRMLKYKVRDYVVKSLRKQALEFISSYEKFLGYKMKEDEIKFSNIIEGLNALSVQSDYSVILIFCGPMHYSALLNAFAGTKTIAQKEITIGDMDITALLDKMKPFTRKNMIMQRNYDVALNILGRKKPERFENPGAILVPACTATRYIPHLI